MQELEREIQELREMMRAMYHILVALTLAGKDYLPALHSPKVRKEVMRRLTYAKKTLLEIKDKIIKEAKDESAV